MIIKIDYYLKEGEKTRIMHHTITEGDIKDYLNKKFVDGELACPMNFDRERVQVEFVIDSITS